MWADIGVGNILTIIAMVIAGVVAYVGWQRAMDAKFAKLDKAVEGRFATMDKGFDGKFSTLEKGFDGKFSALAIQLNTILVGDIAGLRARTSAVEADNIELHKRYHKLANDLNGVGLKIDRLERPHA